jgi:CoA-transferase family III
MAGAGYLSELPLGWRDLGAEVIKVEQPRVGDPIRQAKQIGSVPLELEITMTA